MNIAQEAVEAAAKAIAKSNGEGWLFEPPIIDGVMRSADKSMESYRRDARAALEAARSE